MLHVVRMGKGGRFLLIYSKLIISVRGLKAVRMLMRTYSCCVLLVMGEKGIEPCNIGWIF